MRSSGASPAGSPTSVLDQEQQRAVSHHDGPCLVLAGPGSGKTRVIVERFLRLSAEGISPDQQLVLTYTRRAANQMRDRAGRTHGAFAGEPPLSNYHSFAGRLVREWGWLIGVSPGFRIADEAERWLHLEAVLAELRPRTLWNPLRPHDVVDPLLRLIESAKQELVTPAQYSQWAQVQLQSCGDQAVRALLHRHRDAAEVYAALERRYIEHAVLDHDDTILYAERLLREQAAARRAVAERITHVMVDEYQDTNFAQARLVETLVSDHRNLLVVADDDQAIYKFRGASLANLERFKVVYPDHVRVVLSHNYRSTSAIVSAARSLISQARPESRLEKRLTSERGGAVQVELWEADDERSEVVAVASELRRLIDGGQPAPSIAWLFRRHADMRPAIGALRETGVPYEVQGGRGFFTQPEIKDLQALLSASADPLDSQALLRCLLLPSWRVTNRGRIALVRACREHDSPLLTVIRAGLIEGLDEADVAAAAQCLRDIEELHRLGQREDVREIFYAALERSDFLGFLDQQTELARMQMGANLNKFGELLESFADWSDDRRLTTALHYIEVLRNSKQADELATVETAADGVVLLTAHAAKGLEWPMVVVTGCVDSRWPGRGGSSRPLTLPDQLVPEPAPAGDAVIDEERRLFYVAITRCRDRLVLSRALRYPRSFTDERPSPFLESIVGAGETRRVEVPATVPLQLRRPRLGSRPRGDRPAVGVSDIRIFKQCPRRFEYRKRYRMPVRDSLQSWYGTLMHGVLQNAAMRRSAGETIDQDAVAAIWDATWQTTRGPKGAHPELRLLGEQQLRQYVASPAWRTATITAVEQSFSLALDQADVGGRFDRLDERLSGIPTVVDYKTGPPRDPDHLLRDLQVRAYAVALSRQAKSDTVDVELHYLQTAEVSAVRFDRARLNTAHGHLSASAAELASAWQEGEFPARPSAWQCGHCEYRTICDEGRGTEAR